MWADSSVKRNTVRKLHIERLSASVYYGHPAPGQVVLVNGCIRFQGSARDAREFEARLRSRTNNNKETLK